MPQARPPPSTVRVVRTLAKQGNNNLGTALVRDHASHYLYVEKVVDLRSNQRREDFLTEIDVAEIVRDHSRLNSIQWYFTDGPRGYLYFEYCDLGPIDNFLKRALDYGFSRVSQGFTLKACLDIAQALAWMHLGVEWKADTSWGRTRKAPKWTPMSHNDLHGGNVFVSSRSLDPHYPRVVLGDFGYAASKGHKAFRPDKDVRWVGSELAILSGASHTIKHEALFSPEVLAELRHQRVTRYVIAAIDACWNQPMNSWELANMLHDLRIKHHEKHGPPKPLEWLYFPPSTERQPNGDLRWSASQLRQQAVQNRAADRREHKQKFGKRGRMAQRLNSFFIT